MMSESNKNLIKIADDAIAKFQKDYDEGIVDKGIALDRYQLLAGIILPGLVSILRKEL